MRAILATGAGGIAMVLIIAYWIGSSFSEAKRVIKQTEKEGKDK